MPIMIQPQGKARDIADQILGKEKVVHRRKSNIRVPTVATNDAIPDFQAYAKEQQSNTRFIR